MSSTEMDVLDTAQRWLDDGRKVALVTVVRTWGSAPRQAGSQLIVRDDGAFVGSVSGGCIEGAVIEEALGVIAEQTIRKLQFGVSDETAWSVGLACGGRIELFVEIYPVKRDILNAINDARRDARALVRATDLETGEDRLITPGNDSSALGIAAAGAARADTSGPAQIDGRSWFLTVFNPPLDLVIVGAVHIAQPLVTMATLAGYDVRIIDPRQAFATAARFPGVAISHAWPDEALADRPLSSRSAIVFLSHDPKIDDPGLIAALRSNCFYIGTLGSKKTQAARQTRMKAAGFGEADMLRLHGPVGLDIGARSPSEIAVSILAQMTLVLRGNKKPPADMG